MCGKGIKTEPILQVSHLKKYFSMGDNQILKAVDDVSFEIYPGKTLGLVGESGCGKTTCGRTCTGLYSRTGGQVLFKGQDVHEMRGKVRKEFTKKVQTIFQDPYASLDPRMKVSDIIAEGMRIHHMASKSEEREIVQDLLKQVGLQSEHANRYIHEFSGGQRQRIGIARALAIHPEFLVCDEPISALDVSIQAQIINLLREMQEKMGLTYLFVAHDLSMVRHISDQVAVMYLGKIVELTSSDELYSRPVHPYTQALLSAIPIPDPDVEEARGRIVLNGDVPSPISPPRGCRFCGRCKYATKKCSEIEPEMKLIGTGHYVACHLYD